MKLSSTVFSAMLVVAGASVWFVVSTITLDEFPDAVLMAAVLLTALAFVSAFAGTPVRAKLVDARRLDVTLAAVGGALSWFVAPMLVFSQRSTDAPAGSEVLFLTTAAWGLVCVLIAFADRVRRPVWSQLAGALLALLGSATILANWERPSSFSPFVKFPVNGTLFIIAGVIFAGGTLLVVRSARRLGTRTSLWFALGAAAAVSLVALVFFGVGTLSTWARLWPQILLLGTALGSLAVGWTPLAEKLGLARPASLLFVPPLAISGLAALERALGVYGPNPIVWLAASSGALILVAGAALTWGSAPLSPIQTAGPGLDSRANPAEDSGADPADTRAVVPRSRRAPTLLVLGGLATLLGVVTLALPAFRAQVDAVLPGGEAFHATWSMLGYESAAGWLALVGGVLALAGALDLEQGSGWRAATWTALTGLLAVASYPFLASTPLRTWNLWIPADVQQSYGTEYAHLSMNVTHNSVRFVALALSAVACVTLLVFALGALRSAPVVDDVEEETV